MTYNGQRTSHFVSRLAAARKFMDLVPIYEEAIREDHAGGYNVIEWIRLNRAIDEKWDTEEIMQELAGNRVPRNTVKALAWRNIRGSSEPIKSPFELPEALR